MSRAQRRKTGNVTAARNQLDLFGSARVAPQSQQQRSRESRESNERSVHEQSKVPPSSSVEPDVTADRKLLNFVLGANRRGRPPKVLRPRDEKPTDEKRLLDVREAAARLGLSKSTLDKMRCSGRGPRFIRATDRAIRYDPEDLKAFADERRRDSTSQMTEALNA